MLGLVHWLPLMKRPNPQPPVAAYFLESLTITWTVVAAPGMVADANSGDCFRFQARLTRMVPSGNGSFPA